MFRKFTLFVLAVSFISVQAAEWYQYEYNASTTPDQNKPEWSCCSRAGKLCPVSDGIYKYVVSPGKGWNHWQISGKSFTIPETAKGATIEFKVWAPKTQNRGMRLHIEDAKQCTWIMFLKNNGKEQILQIRSSKKDKIIKLPNQFNTIRIVISRKNGRNKASVFLNNSLKPVIKNWTGFGKKANYAKIGFGAYNTKLESGTLLVDYVRWNPEQAVIPEKKDAQSLPMVRVSEISKPPVIDGILNDKCYKSLKSIKLYTWRKGKSKKSTPPVQLKICRDSKKLYFALNSKEQGRPEVSEKLPGILISARQIRWKYF